MEEVVLQGGLLHQVPSSRVNEVGQGDHQCFRTGVLMGFPQALAFHVKEKAGKERAPVEESNASVGQQELFGERQL